MIPILQRLHDDYNNGLPASELTMPKRAYPLIETYLRALVTQLSFVEAITTERQGESMLLKFVFRRSGADAEV
ncbi:MAG: hypothetical protein ACOYIS_05775 [Candidatus Cloacimonadaceae bacterium]|jgi:hypothetical protein